MNIEQAVYSAVVSAITDYAGYSTVWDSSKVFYVEDFDTDIPSGTKHKGVCPFVAVRGGVSSDLSQVAGDLYSGTVDFELMLLLELPLVSTAADWGEMHQFSGEIDRAIASISTDGFMMKAPTSKEEPRSRKGMITRILTATIDVSECRAAAGPPVFQVDPVLSGTPKEGYTLTVTNGTVIGSDPITYSYNWLKDGLTLGAADQNTYIVQAGEEGTTISCIVTASNGILPNGAEESNGLEIVAMLPPVNTVAPLLTGTPNPGEVLSCTDGTWTGDAPITYAYTWYKDLVLIPLETANTYTVLAGDVGSDILCKVLASNSVGTESADSNALSIVSGLDGIVDTYPGAELIFSNFVQKSGHPTNNASIIVGATPFDIGYSDNKFDGAAWDTATGSGASTAYITDWYDQNNSGIVASQSIGANQAEIDRDGAMVADYATKGGLIVDGTYSSDANEKATIYLNFNATQATTQGYLFSWDGTGIYILMAGANFMRFIVDGVNIGQFNVFTLADGEDHLMAITLDGTNIAVDIDDVNKLTYTSGYTLTVSSGTIGLNVYSTNVGNNVNNLKDFIFYNGISHAATERTGIYNIWVAQNV